MDEDGNAISRSRSKATLSDIKCTWLRDRLKDCRNYITARFNLRIFDSAVRAFRALRSLFTVLPQSYAWIFMSYSAGSAVIAKISRVFLYRSPLCKMHVKLYELSTGKFTVYLWRFTILRYLIEIAVRHCFLNQIHPPNHAQINALSHFAFHSQ